MVYTPPVLEVLKSATFDTWFSDLKDIVVLCGGDKRTQDGDIKRAIEIAASWKGASHGNESEKKAD